MSDEIRIIQINQGTTAQWNEAARVLKAGEFGYDTTLKIVKIGDGAANFNALPTFLNGVNAMNFIDAATTTTAGKIAIATDAEVTAGTITTKAVTPKQLALKVDKVTGKGLSTNDYTTAEKTKLAGLESSHFKGEFTTIAALNAITGALGDYAYVDAGSGADVTSYVWDSSNSKWVEQKGVTTAETPASIKTKYESNADTNAFTDALQTKLNGIAAGAQVNAVTSVAARTGAVVLAKADVGLGSVDNTADSAKSVASAATLTTARTIAASGGVTAAAVSFDGSANITLATVAAGGTPSTQAFGDAAAAGSASTAAKSDHKHAMPATPTTVTGNAGTATKLATSRTIGISGGATGTATGFDGSAAITIPVTELDATKLSGRASLDNLPTTTTANRVLKVGTASASPAYSQVTLTTDVTGVLPLANGGTNNTTGLAASATKLATTRAITLSGAVKGTANFDGSAAITIATTPTGGTLSGGNPTMTEAQYTVN
ncbi:MAG: hypothetical protein LBT23_10475 [Synergistaceae bacterium]|jgi:hypothetical protein|nr:hypothetical protein [Synergistaceae bacterium]